MLTLALSLTLILALTLTLAVNLGPSELTDKNRVFSCSYVWEATMPDTPVEKSVPRIARTASNPASG